MEMPDIKGLLVKPRATFEDMLEEISWKKGLAAWFIFSFTGLLFYFLLSASVDYTYIFMNFGFGAGTITIKSMAMYFGIFFSSFLFLMTLSHLGGKIMKGSGTFENTLGLFGYANILTVIKGLLAGFITVLFQILVKKEATSLLMNYTVNQNNLTILLYAALVIAIILDVWWVWLHSTAISVVHNIRLWKGALVVVIANVCLALMTIIIMRII